MQSNLVTFIPIKEIIPFWPSDKFEIPGLEYVGLSQYELSETGGGWAVDATVLILEEIKISVPGMDGFAFLVGRGNGLTEIDVEARLGDAFSAKLKDVALRLQFSSSFFQPVKKVNDKFIVDKSLKHAEVSGKVSFTVDGQGNAGFEAGKTFGIPRPVMIGNTGVIIENMQLAVNLDGKGLKPAGANDGWQGLFIETAVLRIPNVFDGALSVKQFGIGSGGISGTVDYANPKGESLLGLDAKLTRVALTFHQNIPTDTSIEGRIKLPFFEDWLNVGVAIGFDGDVMVRLANPKGASKLEIKEVLKFELSAISFESKDSVFSARLSGKLTPVLDVGGISWPSFDIKELSIDSEGKVKLEGGWQELNRPQTVKLAGIRIEVSRVGFGTTEDGRKWFGLNGAVRLVEGVSAGASVEGLKIVWDDSGKTQPQVTFNGIGVDMKVPSVLDLQGAISYTDRRFVGRIKLTLYPLDKAKIDAILVVGETEQPPKYTYFAIYLEGEWNTGIPIGPVGLYGMAGLFALNYEPGKKPAEAWYEDPTNQEAAAGWYKKPKSGVTDLPKKWMPELDSLAIGAGVTLGVLPMNGYPFNGRLLLVIVFPGPVIMLEGRANLLQDRTKLDEDPLFRALAVLDGREGTFEFGLDAKYAYDKTGALIDINGSAHGYFGEPDHWHLYIGQKTPKEKRIRASLFKLFQASAYFMIDNTSLQTGAWLGYAPEPLKYGPVQVVFEAWIDGNAAVNWQPAQFHGDLWLHGKVGLQIFIIRLGLAVDAKLAADVFDPFYIMAMLGIKVEVFPFPPLALQAKIEWKPEKVTWPPLPLPLKEISVAHRLVSINWPLPREKADDQEPLLLPNYESKEKGFVEGFYLDAEFSKIKMPTSDRKTRMESPVVPLDARLNISFTQPVHDDILIGNNSRSPAEYIEIGDPDKKGENPLRARFSLVELSLEKWEGNRWQSSARRWLDPAGKRQQSGEKLFGSWAPVPAVSQRTNIEQTKLWLWSETPFEYTRSSGKALEQWYTEKLPDGPCVPVPPKRPSETYEFTKLNRGDRLLSGWGHPENPALIFEWKHPAQLAPVDFSPEISGLSVALRFPSTNSQARPNWVTIRLPQNVDEPHYISRMGLLLTDEEAVEARSDGSAWIGPGLHIPHPQLGNNTQLYHVMIDALPGKALKTVEVRGGAMLSVLAVTLFYDISDQARNEHELRERRVLAGLTQWNEIGQILEPYSQYRLKISTTVETQGNVHPLTAPKKPPELKRTIVEHAYFQTDGPPGLTTLSRPIGLSDQSKKDFTTGLENLDEYVSQTLPPSIPSNGSKRLHPKPYYRAFDVGVKFNPENNYVDLMYHLADRDLMLYLYDNNDQPARDAEGRIVVSPAQWDKKKRTVLLEQQQRFLSLLKNCSKSSLPPIKLPDQLTVSSYNRVLAPDTAYEARLKPLLINDNLAFKADGRWLHPEDANGRSGPSKWVHSLIPALAVNEQRGEMRIEGLDAWKVKGSSEKIGLDASVGELRKISKLVGEARKKGKGFYTIYLADDRKAGTQTYVIRSVSTGDKRILLEGSPRLPEPTRWSIQPGVPCLLQSSNLWGGSSSYSQPRKPGTILPLAAGAEWTDYRFTVILRSLDDDAIGVVFRYQNAQNYYLYTMDRQRRYRRLIRVKEDRWTILQSDDFVYETNRDYAVTIEVLGEQIIVFLEQETVFSLNDNASKEGQTSPALLKGTIGLYSWANNGATFRDLSVDDLSRDAVVVYRFPFTTSRFANFVHHIHSFQDEVWLLEVDEKPEWKNAQTVPETGKKVVPLGPPGSAEGKSYIAAAKKLLGAGYLKTPRHLEITRITDNANDQTWALLFQSPEPIDWERTQLVFKAGPRARSETVVPPGPVKMIACSKGGEKNTGQSVDILLRDEVNLTHCRVEYIRMPDAATTMENEVLLADDFSSTMEEVEWTDSTRPLLWSGSENDFFAQAEFKDRNGNSTAESYWILEQNSIVFQSDSSESIALIGEAGWMDYQFAAEIALEGSGECGLLMRYRDEKNYYRLGINAGSSQWQLTRIHNGVSSSLGKGGISGLPVSGRKLRFRVQGAELKAYWGNGKLFEVHDASLHTGLCGLFCSKAEKAVFKDLMVIDYSRRLGQWRIHDLGDPKLGPSYWKTAHGALWQRSNIWSNAPTFVEPELLGTYVTAGSMEWRDYRMSVRMRSDDNDAIGMIVRYIDPGNYYLLATDHEQGYTRLIKVRNGISQTLWPKNEHEKTKSYIVGKPFVLELEVQGSRIHGFMDGQRLFSISDRSLSAGGVGLFAWANTGACFQDVEVRSLSAQANALFTDHFEDSKKWRTVADDRQVRIESMNGEAVLDENEEIWAGSRKWKNFVFSSRLRMAGGGKSMGVLFRFVDKENHYRFTLSAEGMVLSRINQGKATGLWISRRRLIHDERYDLVIKMADEKTAGGEQLSKIELYLDGVPLCRISDQGQLTIKAGAIGLFSGADTRCFFSAISVLPVENSFNRWLLNERFDELDSEVWTVSDEVESSQISNWSVENNELKQTSNIYGYVPGSRRKHLLGTCSIAGNSEWTDYRFTAEIRSDDDDAIGVMFRYRDEKNHYRFYLDQERKVRRLVKVVDGSYSVLWEQPAGLSLKSWHLMVIDVYRARLKAYLNGETLFDINDADFIKSGRIGLFCWANKDARFRNITVAPATWVSFYTFGQESVLPAGAQVRLHAGKGPSQSTQPFAAPSRLNRYNPAFADTDLPRLRSTSETLRFVYPDGSTVHARIFGHDRSYNNHPVKIVRSYDGTGFLIVPESDNKPFNDGSFMCRFVYLKNAGDVLPVLRERGSYHAEFAEIKVD